jgi:hypothetical protein
MIGSFGRGLRSRSWLRWGALTALVAVAMVALVVHVRRSTCWYDYENSPTAEEAQRWRTEFADVVLPECANFRGWWSNDDITAFVFGMSCNTPTSERELWAGLKQRLPDFRTTIEEPEQLALVRDNVGTRSPVFDEWRFMLDPATGRVTVLYCSIDADEMRCHDALVRKLAQCHAQEGVLLDTAPVPRPNP